MNVRNDFPRLLDPSLVYLDSAATTQKPYIVIDTISSFYRENYGTVHRAVYKAAQEATHLYNNARHIVASFINAPSDCEVVFTRGTTDSLNIIADSMSASILKKGSVILISEMEHHANIIPWQMAAQRSGAKLDLIPITEEGLLRLDILKEKLEKGNVSVVALTHGSNVLGTINPIAEISKTVHDAGAFLVVDGAQTTCHTKIDVQKMDCDFFCFSSHKVCGPTGVGILWGKEALLEKLPPTRGGGDMIDTVTFEKSTWGDLPLKFEPGTPMIAESIGLGSALTYLSQLGMESIQTWEEELFSYLSQKLTLIPEIQLFGTSLPRCPLQSFLIHNIHPLDIATLLDLKQIAIRSGNLCSQPLLNKLKVSSLCRASLSFYNTKEDIDRFIEALHSSVLILLS